jgi:hypothetical protein
VITNASSFSSSQAQAFIGLSITSTKEYDSGDTEKILMKWVAQTLSVSGSSSGLVGMLLTLPARGRDWWIEYEKVHSILHRRAQGPDRRRPIIEEISLFSTDVLRYNSWYLRFSAFSGPGKGLRHGTKHRTSRQWYRNEVISARYIILRTSKSDIKLGFCDLTLCHLALIPSEERRLSRIRQHESTWSCVFFHYSRDIRARPQSFSLPNIWHGLSRVVAFAK